MRFTASVLTAGTQARMFQIAMGEAYRLQARARRAATSARVPQAQTATVLDPPLSTAVEALSR